MKLKVGLTRPEIERERKAWLSNRDTLLRIQISEEEALERFADSIQDE